MFGPLIEMLDPSREYLVRFCPKSHGCQLPRRPESLLVALILGLGNRGPARLSTMARSNVVIPGTFSGTKTTSLGPFLLGRLHGCVSKIPWEVQGGWFPFGFPLTHLNNDYYPQKAHAHTLQPLRMVERKEQREDRKKGGVEGGGAICHRFCGQAGPTSLLEATRKPKKIEDLLPRTPALT